MRLIIANRFCSLDELATSRMVASLVTGLVARGHQVHVVASQHYHNCPDRLWSNEFNEFYAGVKVHRVWMTSFGYKGLWGRALGYLIFHVNVIWRIRRLAREGNAVIACTNPPLLPVSVILATLGTGPILVSGLHDLHSEVAPQPRVLDERRPMVRLLLWLRNASLRRARRNVTSIRRMADFLSARRISYGSFAVIRQWASGTAIHPAEPAKNRLRHAMNDVCERPTPVGRNSDATSNSVFTGSGALRYGTPTRRALVPHIRVGMLTASVSRKAGGLFFAVSALVKAMHRPPELDVRVYGQEDTATKEDLASWEPVPVHTAQVHGPRSFGFSAGLKSRIAEAGLDVLHVHGLWMYPSVVAQRWSAHARAPYVVSPHGMLDPWALRNSEWKKRCAARAYERRHLQHAACVHALCESELEAIRAFGLTNPVCVIPNGVRIAQESLPNCLPPWRSVLGNKAKVLLYLGRLHPKKGLKNLLLACALLQRTKGAFAADWKVVIAGWDQDDHRAELERLVAELGLNSLVCFVGPLFGVDKDAALMAADGFILPSLSEGLPMAVLEAWAHGLPVLMTRQCNLEEAFHEGAALRVEPETGSIAEGLRLFFEMSDDRRREIGRAGRRIVATRFDWTGIGTRMEEVYRWILGMGPRPDCVHLATTHSEA